MIITKKTKMFYETDDYAELTDFYNSEAEKQADSAEDYGEESHDEQIYLLNYNCIRDKKILIWRQLHRDKYDKYLAKLEAKKQKKEKPTPEPSQEEPKAEQPTKIVQCTAVEIINRDLLTSPTETGPDIAEAEEE